MNIFWMLFCLITSKNFNFPIISAKLLPFHLEKNSHFVFFTNNILILLVYLNNFRQYFLLICEKESISSWFWQDLCSISDPISLVNPNNSQCCIFIVKKCHPLIVFFIDFILSNPSHFHWNLLFLSIISFGTSEIIIPIVISILFSTFFENIRFSFDL